MTTTATASIAATTGILTASSISAGGVIQPGAQVNGPGINPGGLALAAQNVTTVGTNYDSSGSGTFTGCTVTGGSGSGALATVVVVTGGITAGGIIITTPGSGYCQGDVLSIQASTVGTGTVSTPVQFQAALAAPPTTPVIIQPYGTAGTTGTGGNGTYATNISTAVASATMTFTLTEPPVNTLQLQGVPSPVPAWNSGTAYVAQNLAAGAEGSVVQVATLYYLCIAPNTNHTPPNATYWEPIPESLPAVITIGTNSLALATIPVSVSVIPPKPFPSGTANTSVGVPI